MPYQDLQDFVAHLQAQGDLVRVKCPVSTHLEMTEIQTRLIRDGGPAVFFENVIHQGAPCSMPVVVNLFGTKKRIATAVQQTPSTLRSFGEKLASLRSQEAPHTYQDIGAITEKVKALFTMRPKQVRSALCQQRVFTGRMVDLDMLPIQGCWPNEPAPLITWGMVVTKGPNPLEDRCDNFNLGIYRMQKIGKNKTIMRWLRHRGGAQHHRRWGQQSSDPLPCAVVIGCDPATILSAVIPVPDSFSEYKFSGLLRQKRLALVKCKTQPINVPANAEIVLEGYVSLREYAKEGPYGDHTGYYNHVEEFPIFTCTAMTMRRKPCYLSTYTGRFPDEPSVLGEALNDMFVPFIQQQFPEITDLWLPPEGCSYRIAVIAMKKAYPGHAKRVMMGVWSYLRQFMYTKWLIIVDSSIDIRDWKQIWWAVSTKMDPARDITLIENTPIDYLDFASHESGLGSKIGLDATDKMYPETHRQWGKEISMSKDIVDKVTNMWDHMGLPPKSKNSIWK